MTAYSEVIRYLYVNRIDLDKRDSRVRREKAVVHSGRLTRPGTGSLHPVAIRAAVEATRLLKPLVPESRKGDLASMQAVT
jgi:hypothetical protein